MGAGRLLRVNHLKDVPIDGFAEKESLERRGPQWCDQFRPLRDQALFECAKFLKRIADGDVVAEFAFKGRNDETFRQDDMNRLSEAEIEPEGLHRRVSRHRTAGVSKRPLEEGGGLFHVKRRQGQMQEAHRFVFLI